jgi:RNA polymerase sigma-70 factor (ECF subfamily)
MSDGQLLECFLERQDEAAFEALVRLHGPMVLGICRRLLENQNDAEDAFQATFLVLVRKAASVAPREMVGNWLYGVAYRTALKARAATAKRRKNERQVTEMPEREAVQEDDVWRDLQPLLDRELNRLPDKYRVPIVLCDLEGKTHKEAAGQLGWPEGTLSVRLMRARTTLARRLARHGLKLSVGTLAIELSHHGASACVPTSVVFSTVKAATSFAAGHAAAAGVILPNVAALTEGVLKSMLLTKLKIAAGVLLVVAATVGMGAAALIHAQKEDPATKELERLQGTWVAVSAERQGKEVPEEKVKEAKITLVISMDKFTLKTARGTGELKGTLKIDPTRQPKTMDWSALRPEDKNAVNAKGIYQLDGDTLRFCYGGQDRPSKFKTKADRDLDQRMHVFRREK